MFAILQFELRQRFTSISTYVYFLMFFALAMLWMAAAGGAFSGAVVSFGGKVSINAPVSVSQTITFLGYMGIVIVAAMMGRGVQQDAEHNIWHFFYTAPLKKYQYLGGRFLGAYLTLLAIFSSIGLGAWLGCYLPGIEANRLGPIIPGAYFLPYFFSIMPNFLVFGALFFMLGAVFKRMLPVYISSVVLLIGYMIAKSLGKDLDDRTLAALIDAFGSSAISRVTEYWSIAEKNHRLVPLQGLYLANRLIWLAIGACIFAIGYWRFSFTAINTSGKQKKTANEEVSSAPAQLVRAIPNFASRSLFQLFIKQSWLNLKETVKNVYFIVILLTGVLFMFAMSDNVGKMFGTTTYPVTYAVLQLLGGSFGLFILIITTFYAGELVWRERDARISQLLDALPVPNWLPLLSKLFALISLQAILLFIVMLCGMLIQLFQGFTHLQAGLYLKDLFIVHLPEYALVAVLAISLQVVINHKYAAHFAMILYYIAGIALPALGFEHPMFLYGTIPNVVYSDMNGYGHFLAKVYWFQFFWSGAAILLITLSMLLWVRGTTSDWRGRLRLASLNVTGATRLSILAGFVIFLGAGGILFYNLNILNHYQNSYDKQLDSAQYEKLYKQYETRLQPRIIDVNMNVDIYPERRSASIKGSYQLVNRGDAPIEEVFVNENDDANIINMQFDRASSQEIRDKRGFYSYKLRPALQPGEKMTLNFELGYAPKGILGLGGDSHVIGNGTFFNSGLMPQIGYQPGFELSDEKERSKHGLPARERMADRDDPKGLANNYISNDADWISFDATVSTSADQIAIAPGKLDKEWTENGRRYFHYTLDKPILNFYAFQSARYVVKRDKWQDVAIEIDYNKGHEYDLDRMIKGVQASLAYYTANFGPYQHKLVRIVEFPRYANFAQAFPNSIPYSESIGFIAKVDDKNPKDLDYPFYVTAHEVAHQWWAHQVVSGNTKGATVLSETLAQYSALMVMKQMYGDAKMRRFLRYELDGYLFGRSQERKKELPLARNENQPYIHYQKGSLVMYELQDQIGEDKVNAALRDVIAQYANKGAPYPNSRALVDALRKVTPQDRLYLIDDLFESITLFENRALSATAKAAAGGQYEVKLKISANKLKAGELGEEKEVALKDWIDIGVDDKDGKPLLRDRKYIDRKEMEFIMLVKGEPAKAGIDPDNKLIDHKPDDNLVKVDMQ
ncbi:ABC transporter permease/M1 family aminopeptidase [Undibacterium terreum]|uniref:Peptidase M1 membrane alanine aminopeptidase domain-containing protein n=1 Tax=Undibacterium terreum TaxID=1224302 RepID=A0A916UWN2_9BURK|nr:M1 family aminopeptidase [Undibacterium terreum]GGC91559.1 hypothetical protein GCM10011396_43550 [Undibacterium terreum]